jgi:RNA polymerase sigma-70 factor (ECF subfamily)
MTQQEKIIRLIYSASEESSDMPDYSIVEQAFKEHDQAIRNFLLSATGSATEAEDILQEMYLNLVKKQPKQDQFTASNNGIPKAYLLVAATNIIRDRKRRDRVRSMDLHRSIDDYACKDGSPLVENQLIWRQGVQIVDTALKELKPIYREVFLLHRLENLSFPQISERTGIPLRTVQRYSSHALLHCKEALEKHRWF